MQNEYWLAINLRDRSYDGVVFYGVSSTKIYCLPSCPARKPKKSNTILFETHIAAEAMGFRPCKRCLPNRIKQPIVESIEQICRAIEHQLGSCHTLDRLATECNLSPAYLQRKFKHIVGITSRQYTEASRLVKFKLELRRSQNIALAIYLAGYNSSSSLYEKISSKLGMTPKIYQQHGKQTKITYTIVSCELGYLLVATTEKGICAVKLGDRPEELSQSLTNEFKQAVITFGDRHHRDWIEKILNLIVNNKSDRILPLDIRGTAFQYQVWQALQKIPYAETRTYKEIAQDINKPNATRAIGNACGANPVALIVPCHRVIRSDGNLGGYRWGVERKQKLLETETRIKSLSPFEDK